MTNTPPEFTVEGLITLAERLSTTLGYVGEVLSATADKVDAGAPIDTAHLRSAAQVCAFLAHPTTAPNPLDEQRGATP